MMPTDQCGNPFSQTAGKSELAGQNVRKFTGCDVTVRSFLRWRSFPTAQMLFTETSPIINSLQILSGFP